LGQWIKDHWQGEVDRIVVLEEPRAGSLPAARIRGQIDGLQSVIGQIDPERITVLDSENTTEVSERQMSQALRQWWADHKIAVIPFNSNATLGVLAAARKADREQDVAIVGQGGDRRLRQEIRRPNTGLIGSTGFMHEKYGRQLLNIALKILRGEPVPPATYTDHIFITPDNIDLFYPDE
jgi:ABC-type sugar transport system substrate-binding protein